MFRYFTLDNFDFKDKIVGIRIDVNSPIREGKIILNQRIRESVETIKELSEKGAKVVILAHQGRFGKLDCISLKEHSKYLSDILGKKILFIPEIYSKAVETKIKNLKSGKCLMLENLRFHKDETVYKPGTNFILKLEKHFEFYVFDAFSVSHRNQTSVIGFKKTINIAGRLMERELKGLSKIESLKNPRIFVFGGEKPDDLIKLMQSALSEKEVDLVLLSGVIGEIALFLKGFYIGKKFEILEKGGFLNSTKQIKKLLDKYTDKIVLPRDVVIFNGEKRIEIPILELNNNRCLLDKYPIGDIGEKTIKEFKFLLQDANSIYFKGPPGNFENENFAKGTEKLLKAVTSSKAFTFMGGGHSVTAAEIFGQIKKFSYISLAGGALVKFLSDAKLVGIKVLEESYKKYEHFYENFIVVGSNTLDTYITSERHFYEMKIGDKERIIDDFKTSIGGGGINVSVTISRLGKGVGYLGKLSEENLIQIKEVLNKNKVNLIKAKISKRPCAKSIVLDTADKDRIIYNYKGQNSFFDFNDFSIKSFQARNFYFNSLTKESFNTLVKLAELLKEKDEKIIICYNPSFETISKEFIKLKKFCKCIDILILNFEEAQELTKKNQISNCLKEIYKLGPKTVVITDGKNGCFAFDGKEEYYQKSLNTNIIVDTTGAGDAFGGTFFYFFAQGFGIKKSLLLAAKNAGSVVSKQGPREGLLYFEDFKL